MPRLRSIIETSDMTMYNESGSHLGYCISGLVRLKDIMKNGR